MCDLILHMSQLIPLNDLLHSALDNTHSACMVFVGFFVAAAAAFPTSYSHSASSVRGTNISQVSI